MRLKKTPLSVGKVNRTTSGIVLCVLVSVSSAIWSILFVTFHRSSLLHGDAELSQPLPNAQAQQLQNQLETARRRVKELEDQIIQQQQQERPGQLTKTEKDEIRQVKDNLRQCQQQLPDTKQVPPILNQQQKHPNPNPICQSVLPHPIPTPSALWTSHLKEIHAASQLPNDHKFYFHDFTAQLLHLVSPRLPLSVKTSVRPQQYNQIDRILRLAKARYDYVQNPKANAEARPVKVVIMGGSLLVGMNCRKIIRDLGFQLLLPLKDCSWANRLEKTVNQFLLGGQILKDDSKNIVQVTKIAMGGTNTQIGSTILEYDLIPPEAKNPDIVINAYATNDMHITTIKSATAGNTTLRDKILDMTQEFVRRVMEPSHSCGQPPPLLIHMDDYLGNEQREIMATTELAQSVQLLASYYGFASASYADVVRDWVYGDTHEYWFSPEGWYEKATSNAMAREIHPNMGMHIVAAWVMAYQWLNMVTEFCSLEAWNLHYNNAKNSMNYNNTLLDNLPPLDGKRWPLGKPQPPPDNALPPPLTKTLSLEQVSTEWKRAAAQRPQETCQHNDDDNAVKCPFSWLSGISSLLEKPSALTTHFLQHWNTVEWGDWALQGDHGKLGVVPQTTTLEVPWKLTLKLPQSIRKITVFYMKSYGEKWAGATARVQCFDNNNNAPVAETDLQGFHDKHTSESYTSTLPVELPAGSSLTLQISLVGGSTFKIMGLALCS